MKVGVLCCIVCNCVGLWFIVIYDEVVSLLVFGGMLLWMIVVRLCV